jgi:hypothetical protein
MGSMFLRNLVERSLRGERMSTSSEQLGTPAFGRPGGGSQLARPTV